MKRFLFPVEYYNSTYSINFRHYYDLGYRAILFDVDNTLVPHDHMSDERSRKLTKELREIGFKIAFVSNNKEPRVRDFAAELKVEGLSDIEYVYKAGKPKKNGYVRAMEILGTNNKNTIFVGDQIFTDICGANRAGIHSILVDIIDRHEDTHIFFKRILEVPIKKLYLMKHPKKQ